MLNNPVLKRIRSEYLEMPGLRLTLQQAQRFCGVEPALCQAVLDALVEAKFLHRAADGTYARSIDNAHDSRASRSRVRRARSSVGAAVPEQVPDVVR